MKNQDTNGSIQTWDMAIKLVEQESSKLSPFFIVDPGRPQVVAIIGEPFVYEGVYIDGKWQGYNPHDERHNGIVPALRIALACYLQDLHQVRVLEMDVVFFRDVLRAREKYGLDEWWFEITNHEDKSDEPCPLMSLLPEARIEPNEKVQIAGEGTPVIGSLYTRMSVCPL